MKSLLELTMELADEVIEFPLGECGPSDDPDKQYAYTAGFRDIAKRFVGAIRRIGDPDLSAMVENLDTSPEFITQAHELRANLFVVIDSLKEAASGPDYQTSVAKNSAFLNTGILTTLKSLHGKRLDTRKLAKMCAELNDAYARGNYITCLLLLRVIINHVPPVFGASTFSQVVSNSGKSEKKILSQLEEARPIADLYNHLLMRETESLPTRNQLEPYKPSFETLIQNVIMKLNDPKNDGKEN